MELSTQERGLSCTGRVLPTLKWAGGGGEGGHGCKCLMRCSGRVNRGTSLQKICCSGSRWICVQSLSHVQLFATPWTVALQAPLSMGILQTRILEWVAMPSSRDLPNPGVEPRSPALQANSLPSEPPGKPRNTAVGSLFLLQGLFLTQDLVRSG